MGFRVYGRGPRSLAVVDGGLGWVQFCIIQSSEVVWGVREIGSDHPLTWHADGAC